MTKIVKEELEHIPRGKNYDVQAELRLLYNAVRRQDLKLGRSKEETLAHCIEVLKQNHASVKPHFDENFFKLIPR